MILKKCPKCGEDNNSEAIICKYCGASLENKNLNRWHKRELGFVLAIVLVLVIISVVSGIMISMNLEPNLKEMNFADFTMGVSAETNLNNDSAKFNGDFQVYSDNKTKTLLMFVKSSAISKSSNVSDVLFNSATDLKKIDESCSSSGDTLQFYNWTNNKEGYTYLATYTKDNILIIVAADNLTYLKEMISSIDITNGIATNSDNNLGSIKNALFSTNVGDNIGGVDMATSPNYSLSSSLDDALNYGLGSDLANELFSNSDENSVESNYYDSSGSSYSLYNYDDSGGSYKENSYDLQNYYSSDSSSWDYSMWI